ncbi:glycosyltransferase [Lactococcus hircilactis]|uniref:glycosyltransferase n=1 Tax=Lactococcus hircilactis TaxID=1494462 RepID=UPI003FA313D0
MERENEFAELSDELESQISFLKNETELYQLKEVLKQPEIIKQVVANAESLKIAAVILVKNQEKRIEKVIDALTSWNLDEIIVLDTGSTDDTVSILTNKKGLSFYQTDWVEDFGFMRNKVAEFTDADWILTIDSDEFVLTHDVSLKLLLSVLTRIIAEPFSLEFEQHYPNRSDYGFPERCYSPKSSYYFGKVHEELRDRESHLPLRKIPTRICIENQGVLSEEADKFSKSKRYTQLLYEMMAIEPDNPRWPAFLIYRDINEIERLEGYEALIKKYLLINSELEVSLENLRHHDYLKVLLQKYVSFLITTHRLSEGINIANLALEVNSSDTYIFFFKSFAEIELLKAEASEKLKEALSFYLSLDKQESYDNNHQDTQLIEIALAEFNLLNGNIEMARKILTEITDERSYAIWEGWQKNREGENNNGI